MRTALEMINILFVACETKVRRKEQDEEKTNNYCIWNPLESGTGERGTVDFYWVLLEEKTVCVCVCAAYHLCTTFGWNVN